MKRKKMAELSSDVILCTDSHYNQRDLLPVDLGGQDGVGDENGCVEAAERATPEAERDEDLGSQYSSKRGGETNSMVAPPNTLSDPQTVVCRLAPVSSFPRTHDQTGVYTCHNAGSGACGLA